MKSGLLSYVLSFVVIGCGIESDLDLLRKASSEGDTNSVLKLLENDLQVQNENSEFSKDLALESAVSGNHLEIIKILLECGANSSSQLVQQSLAMSDNNEVISLFGEVKAFDEIEKLFNEDIVAFREKLRKNRDAGKKMPLPSKYGVHQKFYPKFRAIRSDHSAPPIDRGRALLWCFINFRGSDLAIENKGLILTKMVQILVRDWADEEWSSGLALAISRNKTMDGFDADSSLANLETAVSSPARKADAAYQRVSLHRRGDKGKLKMALNHFIENYPEDNRLARVKGYLKSESVLTVGSKAPEFKGKDADGNTIRLSDYLGKVTYVVFWGFW